MVKKIKFGAFALAIAFGISSAIVYAQSSLPDCPETQPALNNLCPAPHNPQCCKFARQVTIGQVTYQAGQIYLGTRAN